MPRLIWIAFLLLPLSTFAQHDFKEGFIILNTGDTLSGMIDYRGDVRNAQVCSFKRTEGSSITDYKPGEIKGYRFLNEKYYISETIQINAQNETVFLEYIVDGITDLYYYRDANRKEHYFIKGSRDASLLELKNTKKEIEANGTSYEMYGKEYIDQLKSVFYDAPELQPQIDNLKFTRDSFISVTRRYHDAVCNEYACTIYEKKQKKGKWSLGIAAGFSYTSLKSNGTWYYNEMALNSGDVAFGGFVIGENLKGLNERLSLVYSLMYSAKKFGGEAKKVEPNFFRTTYINSAIYLNSLTNKAELIYGLTTKPTGLFISGGAFYAFQFNSYTDISILKDYSVSIADEEYNFTEDLSDDWGITAGVGYRMTRASGKKVLIKGEYLMGFGMRESSENTPPVSFTQEKSADPLRSGTFQLVFYYTL